MSMIELNNLAKNYGSKAILSKFTLHVSEGEFVALTGASGRGKSTLLNIIGLIENFDEGEYRIENQINVVPNSRKANKLLRQTISYLFQNFALIDDETVAYNLNLALKYLSKNSKEKKIQIQNALNKVGLQGYENRKVYELSGGEQQRIAIARIMLKPCKIILADEPTGSLDEKNRDIIIELLKNLNREGKTIIIATHDKHIVKQCQRVVNL